MCHRYREQWHTQPSNPVGLPLLWARRVGEVLPPSMPLLVTIATTGRRCMSRKRSSNADSVLHTVATQTRTLLSEGAGPIRHSHYWYGRSLLALGRAEEALPVLELAAANYKTRLGVLSRYLATRTEVSVALVALDQLLDAETVLLENERKSRRTKSEAVMLERLIQFYRDSHQVPRAASFEARQHRLDESD